MERLVLATVADGLCWLRLNRPAQRNAMSPEMMEQLHAELIAAHDDESIGAVVLGGTGDHFSAGGDIKAWSRFSGMSGAERGEDFRRRVAPIEELFTLIDGYRKPIIAAVRGNAAGGGLSLILAADFVLAETGARFIFANIRAALSLDLAMSYHLPRIVGFREAARLSLLGASVDTAAAERMGLVGEIVAEGELDARVQALGARLTAAPREAMAQTRALLRQSFGSSLEVQYRAEVGALSRCAEQDDLMEAVNAFGERRDPIFGRNAGLS